MAGFLTMHVKFDGWYAGWCNGPRYTSELVPVLVALLAWWLSGQARRTWSWLLGALVGLAILVNLPLHLFPAQSFQWNIFPNLDQWVQARVWGWRDWQPLHFRHFLALGQGREAPAFALVRNEKLSPLPDAALRYRVGLPLAAEPTPALRVTNLPVFQGRYLWRLRESWRQSGQALATLALDLRNQWGRRQELAVAGQGELELLTAQITRLGD